MGRLAPPPWGETSMGELPIYGETSSVGKNVYGRFAHGAKYLALGETSMGRIAHIGRNVHVLFLSRPRSEGWPHRGRTFSIYLCPLSF